MRRLSLAFRCFFSLLFKGTISDTMVAELLSRVRARAGVGQQSADAGIRARAQQAAGPVPAETAPPAGPERAIQMLALLQRDGRLIDFFTEDIAEYDDAQVGAAVRDMHESCRATLNRYLELRPVIGGEEGRPVTIEPGFEPGTIKLIGNVTGRLPARGVLRHHGWRAGEVRLPDVPTGASRSVIAPAEVEIA